MPRNHYRLIASVTPALGASMLADVAALLAMNNAKTFLATPEVTLTNDPDDATRMRASVHVHVLAAEKPAQVRKAFVAIVEKWKAAGAELDEAGLDDDDLFLERPELKRRKSGEAVPKPISVQLADALTRASTAEAQLTATQPELARVTGDLASSQSARGKAETLAATLRKDLDARIASDAQATTNLQNHHALVEAVRAFMADPTAITEVQAAFAPFNVTAPKTEG